MNKKSKTISAIFFFNIKTIKYLIKESNSSETQWTEKTERTEKERENGFQAKLFFFFEIFIFLFPFNQKIIRAKDINIKPKWNWLEYGN